MKKLIYKYLKYTDGATAIEYGLIAASIAVAISVVAFIIGGDLETIFLSVSDGLQAS